MKFFATLAVASALAFASAQDAACPTTLVATATTTPDAVACKDATGFSAAAALASFPAADALAKICANPSCQNLLKTVTAAVPTECTLAGVKVKAQLVDKFAAACKGAAAGGAADAKKAGSGSGAGAAVITTPAPSKEASGASKAEEAPVTAGSGASSTPVSSAKPSAVPTATPKATSAASTVAAATGAVVMAVAATML